MTRPMPGPPDWYDIDWNPVWGMVWIKNDDECDETFNHAELDKKRLTMEGCAAHYWQACQGHTLAQMQKILSFPVRPERPDEPDRFATHRKFLEAATWHRFFTTPHALDSDGAAS